jgi:hypothetical protein
MEAFHHRPANGEPLAVGWGWVMTERARDVLAQLWQDLTSFMLPPGEWPAEEELSQRYGASRRSVREALRKHTESSSGTDAGGVASAPGMSIAREGEDALAPALRT